MNDVRTHRPQHHDDDLHRLAAGYALDALEPDDTRAFEEHLVGCDECRAEVAAFTETAARLGAAVATTPRPEVRAAVLDAVRAVRPLPPLTAGAPVADFARARERRSTRGATGAGSSHGSGDRRGAGLLRGGPWAVAAAVLAVATAGTGAVAWDARGDAERALADRQEVVRMLAGTGGELTSVELAGAPATVIAADDRILLVGERVPSPPEGLVYQLWLLRDGEPTSAGVLDVGPDGAVTALAEDAVGADSVGVTVEPAGGSPRPTTDPVLLAELPRA